jgi:pimeloyl-ACP methyl ester carboxylesterase
MLNKALWTLCFGGGGMLLMLYTFQNRLVYVPYMPPDARSNFLRPEDFFLYHYDKVSILTEDKETLQAWLFKTAKQGAPTILFFHGNAGNLSHRLPNIKDMIERLSCNVFIVSYRGYGMSTGSPTEMGLKADARAALFYLRSRSDIDEERIFVFGRSLGGAVALDLAAQFPNLLRGVIVENTFCSIPSMMDKLFPILSYFKFLCTNRWSSLDIVSSLEIPFLGLSGGNDGLVPPVMMTDLFQNCASSIKRLHVFPEGEHMDTFTADGYFPKFKEFIDEVVSE